MLRCEMNLVLGTGAKNSISSVVWHIVGAQCMLIETNCVTDLFSLQRVISTLSNFNISNSAA